MAAQPPSPSKSRAPHLGRYELIAGIASGGMGAVMLARLAGAGGFQRLFAIKILHRNYATDREFMEMLLDEARITARIYHPNVVGILEVSESAEHGYYLVMDYVEGYPLSDVLPAMARTGPGPGWRVGLRVVLDSLQGLAAAHALTDDRGAPLQVVHRDISPQNILVGADGVSRVTDFGIAKAAARLVQTRMGQVRGKVAYMSPEQARSLNIDARSDLYSLGVVLWETLTLQRLFKGKTDLETYAKLMNSPYRPVREVAPRVPATLDALCARALERDPARRFQSAREMAQSLERVARENDLLADAHEAAEWMQSTFAEQLAERRAAIRSAAALDTVFSNQTPGSESFAGLPVPRLPENLAPAPAAQGTPSGVKPARDPRAEFDDDKPTSFDARDFSASALLAGAEPPRRPAPPAAPAPSGSVLLEDDDEADEKPTMVMAESAASAELQAMLGHYREEAAATRLGVPRPQAHPLAAQPPPPAPTAAPQRRASVAPSVGLQIGTDATMLQAPPSEMRGLFAPSSPAAGQGAHPQFQPEPHNAHPASAPDNSGWPAPQGVGPQPPRLGGPGPQHTQPGLYPAPQPGYPQAQFAQPPPAQFPPGQFAQPPYPHGQFAQPQFPPGQFPPPPAPTQAPGSRAPLIIVFVVLALIAAAAALWIVVVLPRQRAAAAGDADVRMLAPPAAPAAASVPPDAQTAPSAPVAGVDAATPTAAAALPGATEPAAAHPAPPRRRRAPAPVGPGRLPSNPAVRSTRAPSLSRIR